MPTTTDKLLTLADEYEARARGLRMAAAELNGHQVAKKQASVNGLMNGAIALRKVGGRAWTPEQREAASVRQTHTLAVKKAAKQKPPPLPRAERRALSETLLAKFDATPRTLAEVDVTGTLGKPIGSLLRWGYLKQKGGKGKNKRYVRTSLPFDVAAPSSHGG